MPTMFHNGSKCTTNTPSNQLQHVQQLNGAGKKDQTGENGRLVVQKHLNRLQFGLAALQ